MHARVQSSQPPDARPCDRALQVPAFLGAGARHFGFMLRGLRELQVALRAAGIQFFLLRVGEGAGSELQRAQGAVNKGRFPSIWSHPIEVRYRPQ